VHIPPKDKLPTRGEGCGSYLNASAGAGAGMGAAMTSSGGSEELEASPAVSAGERTDMALTEEEWSDDSALASKLARVRGYEGDPCTECGQFMLVRGGTCLRCLSCGAT